MVVLITKSIVDRWARTNVYMTPILTTKYWVNNSNSVTRHYIVLGQLWMRYSSALLFSNCAINCLSKLLTTAQACSQLLTPQPTISYYITTAPILSCSIHPCQIQQHPFSIRLTHQEFSISLLSSCRCGRRQRWWKASCGNHGGQNIRSQINLIRTQVNEPFSIISRVVCW